MRLGLIARADKTGLGHQTYEFYLHMNPAKTLVIDIGQLNGNQSDLNLYPGAEVVHGIPNDEDIREFCRGLDVIFTAESPYNPNLYRIAREMGVKVANQYNYEFTTWRENPEEPIPDLLIAPSTWNFDVIDRVAKSRGVKHVYLHCPVNTDRFRKNREMGFRRFLHPAGKSAAQDRNGTMAVIKASKFLKTDAKIIIKFQGEQGLAHQLTHTTDEYRRMVEEHGDPSKLEFICEETPRFEDVYKLGDVLVLPRRYGGNCLPLNEALACGMPVVMPNISPNNRILSPEWLLPAHHAGSFIARTQVELYSVTPEAIAKKIDEMYLMDKNEVYFQRSIADMIANTISWETLKPKYVEALCSLLT